MPRFDIKYSRSEAPTTSLQPRAGFLPGDNGAVGRAISQFGAVLAEKEAKQKRLEEADYVVTASIDAAKKIFDTEKGLRESNTTAGYSKALMSQIDSIHEEALKNAPSDNARLQLKQRFGATKLNKFKSSISYEENAVTAAAEASLSENANILANELQRNPADAKEFSNQLKDFYDASDNILGADRSKEFKEKSEKYITKAWINGLAATKPDEARALIEGGRFDAIFSPHEINNLVDGINEIAKKEAQAQAKEATKEHQNKLYSLDTEIINDNVTESELNSLNEAGFFKDQNEYNQRLKKVKTATTKREKDLQDIGRVELALTDELPLDPRSKTDRDAAQKYLDTIILAEETDPIERNKKEIAFIRDLGIVPEGVRERVRGRLLNSSSPEQMIETAADVAILMKDHRNIAASLGLGVREVKRVKELVRAKALGLSAQEVEAFVDQKPSKGDSLKIQESIQENVNDKGEYLDAGDLGDYRSFLADDPNDIPLDMQLDAGLLIEQAMEDLGQGYEDAKETAIDTLMLSWGNSSIDSDGDVIYKFKAPELIYAHPEAGSDWIKEQFKSEVVETFGLKDRDYSVTVHRDDIDKLKPRYEINYIDANGIPRTVLDSNGRAAAWYPDYDTYKKSK